MITCVCGKICSGKSTYAEAYASLTNSKLIEVGDIVRKIKKSIERDVLQDTVELHSEIANQLLRETQDQNIDYVISGIRQKEILETLYQCYSDVITVWIECPRHVRQLRFLGRKKEGDNLSFIQAENGDNELGINDLKEYIFKIL